MSRTITEEDLRNVLNKVLPSAVVDYVVEEGTSGIWTYRKWNSGIAECWGEWSSGSFAPDGQAGGWYRRIVTDAGAFPTNLFIEAPKAFFDLTYWGNGYYWGTIRTLTASTYSLQLFRNDNASSRGSGNIYAIGKWK